MISINQEVDFDIDPIDILKFWKRAEKTLSILAAIARDYLSIPAAGVGVERLFN